MWDLDQEIYMLRLDYIYINMCIPLFLAVNALRVDYHYDEYFK